jgi:outer membrane protein TolC
MIKRFLFLFIVLLFSSISYGDEKLSLNNLIEEALKNNPEIIEMKHKLEAYGEIPSQVSSLDDPILGFGIKNLPADEFGFNKDRMTMKELSISQKFPFPGKLSLKGSIANKDVEAVKYEYEEKKNEIIQRLKMAYYELFFIHKSIEITKRNRDLLREFVKIAEVKYSVGKGIQQDVLKAQVELSKLIDQLIILNQKRVSIESEINILLNRIPQNPLGKPADIKLDKFKYGLDEIQRIALESRPALKRMISMIDKSEEEYKLRKMDYYPDIQAKFSYGQRDMDTSDMISITAKINIPIWYKRKQDRGVAQALANKRRYKKRYDVLKNIILFETRDIYAKLKKDMDKIELLKTGILPQAKASLDSAIAGYNVNKVDFLTLLDNQITLLNYEIDYYRAVSDFEKKLAELERVIGRNLF